MVGTQTTWMRTFFVLVWYEACVRVREESAACSLRSSGVVALPEVPPATGDSSPSRPPRAAPLPSLPPAQSTDPGLVHDSRRA